MKHRYSVKEDQIKSMIDNANIAVASQQKGQNSSKTLHTYNTYVNNSSRDVALLQQTGQSAKLAALQQKRIEEAINRENSETAKPEADSPALEQA